MRKILVVGCGKAAHLHVPFFLERSDYGMVAICDTDPGQVSILSQTYGLKYIYYNPEKAIFDFRPDLVIICTPPYSHLNMVKLACNLCADIILEKPVANTYNEAQAIYSMVESAGVRFGVVHNYLFTPGTKSLFSAVENGLVGELISFTKTWATMPSERMLVKPHWSWEMPGGRWTESMPHHLYIALRLCGELKLQSVSLSEVGKTRGVPADKVHIELKGTTARTTIDLVISPDTRFGVMTAMGTSGTVVSTFDQAWYRGWRSTDDFKVLGEESSRATTPLLPYVKSGHAAFLGFFFGWLENRNPNPSNLEEALETMRLTDEIAQRIDRQCKGENL